MWLRYLLATIVVSLLAFPSLSGPERLDPALRLLTRTYGELGPSGTLRTGYPHLLGLRLERGALWVPVMVKVREAGDAWELPHFRPHSVEGRIVTGIAELRGLWELADDPRVVYVEASRPLRPSLDISVPEIGAPQVWDGPFGDRGQGVIVGVVDTGLDITHPAFRVDRDGDGYPEGTRVLWLWDQTLGGSHAEWGLGYGRVFSQDELSFFLLTDSPPTNDTEGHGTHVTGIAAGGEPGLSGVAPEASLVVVKTNFNTSGVIDGIRFVFTVAEALGMPAVVNLSLGGHAGPHDGTSLFEQGVDESIAGPGEVVVVAAGNEANDRIHVGAEVSSPVVWHIEVVKPSGMAQFWSEASFSLEVIGPDGKRLEIAPGQEGTLTSAGGVISVDNARYGPSPLNGAREIQLSWQNLPAYSSIQLTFTPATGGGRLDGWIESTEYGRFLEGDSSYTIAEPGNARRVITVGAYVTRNRWTSQAGQETWGGTLWDLAPFSSRGPTRDGRVKPDLCAPGAWILSARSRDYRPDPMYLAPDGKHAFMAGTSMAAPHVAGACALLLSWDPDLTWDELLAALEAGAQEDLYTGGLLPDDSWGYGKLYVPGAMDELGPTPPGGEPFLEVLANPAVDMATFRYSLPRDCGYAELRVYDILGHLLYSSALPLEGRFFRWDLTDSQGYPLANGLYLVVLITDRGSYGPLRLVIQR